MTRPKRPAPDPGPFARLLLDRRVRPATKARLLAELQELYQHRVETVGPARADRWIRREYRRLAVRLTLGSRLDDSDAPSARASSEPREGIPGVLQDIRQSVRGLRRAPLFTTAIVTTVGLGLGGTTLVFAIVHSVLIAPLPYPDGERMVLLRTVQGENMWSTSMADAHALEETPPDAFESIAAYSYGSVRVAVGTEVELLRAKWVTPDYFPLLGHDPLLGRHFTEAEGSPGGPTGVLVTRQFRDRSFSPGEDVLGRTLLLDGQPTPIVGVLPDRLGPLDRAIEVYPVLKIDVPPRKGPFFYLTIGRIRDGVDPEVARGQLAAVSERIFPIWEESFPQSNAVLGFVDLKEAVVGNVSTTLVIVLAAVGLLLLIASANAASLLAARGVTRAREIAVRAALGASSWRLMRLLLAEAMVIASAAATLGVLIAVGGLEVVRRLGVGQLPRTEEIGMDAESVAFLVLVTLASWALFGFVAGFSTARNRTTGVASASSRATTSPGVVALRRILVGTQFAVTIPLLTGAALLLQSLERVRTESYGFDPEGVVSMLVTLPEESYESEDDVRAFWTSALSEIEALPGIVAAGMASARPPLPIDGGNNFVLADRPIQPGEAQPTAPWITADPGFFRTLGIRIVEGEIYPELPADTLRRAVVDESWVERFYPGESPLGRRFRSGGCTIDGCPWMEIVGVVEDVKTSGLDDTRRLGTMYADFNHDSRSAPRLHVRARGDALSVVPAIRAVIRARDEGVPVGEVRTVTDLASESLAGRRYTSTLVSLLAAVALLLSVVGVYAVTAYHVRQHVRDIGIRIALGASRRDALRSVVQRGMTVAGVGTVVGLALTPALTRSMAGLLYGVVPNDPVVLGSVALGTLAVALAATALPGRHAAATDPAVTLRDD